MRIDHLSRPPSIVFDMFLYAESGLDEMPSGHLIADMEAAKDSLWKKHGNGRFLL